MRTDHPRRIATALLGVVGVLVLAVGAPPVHGQSQCEPGTADPSTAPWQQDRLGYGPASDVWAASRGAGVTVAVLDTAIAPTESAHPQLRSVEVAEPALPDPPPADGCYWHATFVAGLVGARPMSGSAVVGVAPEADVVVVRVTDDVGEVEDVAALARGIDSAVEAGADVVNVSLVTVREHAGLARAVREAVDAGVVVVGAAGNGDPAGPTYPASLDGVIAVGASGPQDQPADFTQMLPDTVSVAAPGVDVISTYPLDRYAQQSGTSFAAALVSGTVALIRSAHPDLTPAQVQHRLEVTADHPAGALPDVQLGWGVVNPLEAVTAVLPEESGTLTPAAAPEIAPPGQPAPPDTTLRDRALAVGGAGAFVAVATLSLAAAVRASRRRTTGP